MISRDQAIEIARQCIKAKPQGYYADPFVPHEWVIDAIMQASALDAVVERPQAPPSSKDESLLGNDVLTCLDRHAGEHPLLQQAAKAIRELRAEKTSAKLPDVVPESVLAQAHSLPGQ